MKPKRPDRARLLAYLALGTVMLAVLGIALRWIAGATAGAERTARGGERRTYQAGAQQNPAARLTGNVLGPKAKAVAAATVCASCSGCDLGLTDSAPTCASSDRDGRYTLQGLPAGEYLVSATAPDYAPGVANGGKPIAFSSQDKETKSQVDINLREGGARLTGVVMDSFGGTVAGAKVQANFGAADLTRGELIAQTTITDQKGQFVLSCSPGPVRLIAVADGHAAGYATRPAPSNGVELIVTPSSSIRGSIVTEQGEPVANVRVMAEKQFALPQRAKSDDSGRFVISGLSSGVYRLRASGDRWLGDYPQTIALSLADTARDVVVTVRRAAAIRGTLLGADGRPCVHGQVHLGPRAQDYSLPMLDATSSAAGAVSFEAVLAGTYQVSASCLDSNPEAIQLLEVGSSDQSGLVWKLEPRLRIEGRVVDNKRNPIPRFLVSLVPGNGSRGTQQAHAPDPKTPQQTIPTSPEGAFAFRGLSAGTYTLHGANLVEPLDVELREQRSITDLLLVAASTGQIEIRVTTSRAKPLDNLGISVIAVADGRPSNPPEEMGNGVYRIAPLAVGMYSVFVGDGINPRVRAGGPSGAVAVKAGETTRVEVLYGGYQGRIVGRVLDDLGSPIENVWVQATPVDPRQDSIDMLQQMKIIQEGRRRLSDREGRFELRGLAEDGTFTVSAERPLGGAAKVENVRAGSTVDVVLQALGRLSGIAVDAKGQPVAHLFLQIANQQTGQQRSEVVSDPAGKWRIRNVTPGRVQITASDPKANVAITSWNLAPRQSLEGIRLELRPRPAP
jgi:hypothetical protein